MTGDNVVCTICHTPFDCRNSAYEIINGAWICGDCIAGHTGEELTEKLEIETMGTIKQFDTTILSTLRADIQRALNSVASEHGITLDLGNIGFQTNTFTAKVIGTVDGFDQSHADYLQYCDQFSLDKSWLCESFTHDDGKRYSLVGLKPSSRKYPVVVERNGKRYKMAHGAVARCMLASA